MPVTTPRLVLATCQVCGGTFERAVGRRKRRCPRCAIEAVFKTADEARARAGASYELTVRKQVAYWVAEAKRLGLEV